MKLTQFVIKNSSELDYTTPLLVELKKNNPECEINVVYCSFSRTQFLRKGTFYSDLYSSLGINQYDFIDFIFKKKIISGLIRKITVCSADRYKFEDLLTEFKTRKINIKALIYFLVVNLIVFLQKKIEILANVNEILNKVDADIYFLGNRSETKFRGRDLLFKKLYLKKSPVVLLPHGTHDVHEFEDAIAFDELGEKITTFNDFWRTLEQESPWIKLGGIKDQFPYIGHPGTDSSWLNSISNNAKTNAGITCLFVVRKFLQRGVLRCAGTDEFTLNYDEMLEFVNSVGDAISSVNKDIKLIIKPHPSNSFFLLKQLLEESRLKNWRVSPEPIYPLLSEVNFVISIFSTTLPIIGLYGIPIILLDSNLQKHVHYRWPFLKEIYGNLAYKLNSNLELKNLLEKIIQNLDSSYELDKEHLRKYFIDGSTYRAIERVKLLIQES
jgi:hypothetical protein